RGAMDPDHGVAAALGEGAGPSWRAAARPQSEMWHGHGRTFLVPADDEAAGAFDRMDVGFVGVVHAAGEPQLRPGRRCRRIERALVDLAVAVARVVPGDGEAVGERG